MPLSARAAQFCYGELVAEAAINLLQGALALAAPRASLAPLASPGAPLCDAALEVQRWFGALNFALGGVLLVRCLAPFEPRALKVVVEALLVGDVIYCASFAPFAARFGALPGAAAPYALTAVMFASRAVLRACEDWDALFAAQAAREAAARKPLLEEVNKRSAVKRALSRSESDSLLKSSTSSSSSNYHK